MIDDRHPVESKIITVVKGADATHFVKTQGNAKKKQKETSNARHKYNPGGSGITMRWDLLFVVVVDLHRTASVAGSFDVAGAIGAAGGEGARACGLARWRGADGRALVWYVSLRNGHTE